uniref:G_PROTEIN_RECEP_F1_2 domain-containing protein n=1 Tax=Panagrellus redivivus TaxID=6233 RepID=A0A7E4UN50_PANRE
MVRRKPRYSGFHNHVLDGFKQCILIFAFLGCVNADDSENNQKMLNDEENETSAECEVQMLQFIEFKFFLVGCLGSTIAIVSIVHNLLLFYTFVSSSLLRRRNLTYLTCLSLCDIFIGISYIGIMSIQVYSEYFQVVPLYVLWHQCLNVAFAVSNITLTTASFLLVAATFERYLQTIKMGSGKILRFVARHRNAGVFLSFLGGIIFRGSVFFEIEVYNNHECQGFASTGVKLSDIVQFWWYDIYRFWIRRIMTIFVPFFVLAYCNAAIVYSLQENERDKVIKTLILYMTMGHGGEVARLKSRVRAATRMLIIVVSCYLFANIIDVIIAFLEYTVPEALQTYNGFYTVATDVSSLLSVLASALRLPIYIANDKLIRQEVRVKVNRIYMVVCCFSVQNSAKRRAFEAEKRRHVYEQLEKASNGALNTTNATRISNSKISIDSASGRIRNGIGSLIIARASVVSAMNDNLAINYDVEKCAVLYERAMAKQKVSTVGSIEEECATDNTVMPPTRHLNVHPPRQTTSLATLDINAITLKSRRASLGSHRMRDHASTPHQESIAETASEDDDNSPLTSPSPLIQVKRAKYLSRQNARLNSPKGVIESWYSSI